MFKIIFAILISHYLILFFDYIYKKIKPLIMFRFSKKSKEIVSISDIINQLDDIDIDFWGED